MSRNKEFLDNLNSSFDNLNKVSKQLKKRKVKIPSDMKEIIFSQISENTENKEMVKAIITKLF